MVGPSIFLSAFLLFTVQLLVGKAALPHFGGSTAVWTTCLLVFQATLLLGYLWSHFLATRLGPGVQRSAHLGLLGLVGALMIWQVIVWGAPLAPAPEGEAISVAAVLTFVLTSVGAPLLLLSTTSPLLQAWFARQKKGAPWRFYALSNAGSFLALILYPFVIEPLAGLRVQITVWLAVFGIWCALLALTTLRLPRGDAPALTAAEIKVGWRDRLTWIGLAALGTLYLAAINNVMCQDIASAPLLWALPLCLYLLSFVITFEGGQRLGRPRFYVLLFLVGLLAVLATQLLMPNVPLLQLVLAYSTLQFAANVLTHGALYRARPPEGALSSFYLWMSVGGVAGTLFVSVGAPVLFDGYDEYPLAVLLVAAGVTLSLAKQARRERRISLGVAATANLSLAVATCVAFWTTTPGERFAARNFFGVLRVQEVHTGEMRVHVLHHGNTTHGVQLAEGPRRDEPTSYYTAKSGLGLGLEALRSQQPALDVAVLGLGVGTISALLGAEDRVTFYDLDPNVIALARGEGDFFHYLQRARAEVEVRLGDGRQALEAELRDAGTLPRRRHLMVVDAFSGDVVPTHLMTTEAFDLYWKHLRDDGLLAVHVSNRHLELEDVALSVARERGLEAIVVYSRQEDLAADAVWMLAARDPALLSRVQPADPRDRHTEVARPMVWTDDYSSVIPVLRFQ